MLDGDAAEMLGPEYGGGPTSSSDSTIPFFAGLKSLEQVLDQIWPLACIFAFTEVNSLCYFGNTFFGIATTDSFQNTKLFANVVKVHVLCSAVMWAIGAVQVLAKTLRVGPRARQHRLFGYVFLLVYWIVVWPTSFWLGLNQRIEHGGPIVTAILLEIVVSSGYFFWRAFRVVRLRRRGTISLVLHGKLMRCGLVMTMAILPQRLIQLVLTSFWWVAYLTRVYVCKPIFGSESTNCVASANLQGHQMNYTYSMIVTSIGFVVCGHIKEGPRGRIWRQYLGDEHLEEAYGSLKASSLERGAWLARWPIYCCCYFAFNPWHG